MTEKAPEDHVLTAQQISTLEEIPISHTLNPDSEVYLKRISDLT
ncbi:MAG: hypothetical protein ACREEE_10735 [Dongiaceae bacterium]